MSLNLVVSLLNKYFCKMGLAILHSWRSRDHSEVSFLSPQSVTKNRFINWNYLLNIPRENAWNEYIESGSLYRNQRDPTRPTGSSRFTRCVQKSCIVFGLEKFGGFWIRDCGERSFPRGLSRCHSTYLLDTLREKISQAECFFLADLLNS